TRDEPARCIRRGAGARGRVRRLDARLLARDHVDAGQKSERVDAHRPRDQSQNHETADSKPARSERQAKPTKPGPAAAEATAAFAAPVLDIAAFRKIVILHGVHSSVAQADPSKKPC